MTVLIVVGLVAAVMAVAAYDARFFAEGDLSPVSAPPPKETVPAFHPDHSADYRVEQMRADGTFMLVYGQTHLSLAEAKWNAFLCQQNQPGADFVARDYLAPDGPTIVYRADSDPPETYDQLQAAPDDGNPALR
jgi:hypothetical protein